MEFDLITFDCYGTLIDWETGIWTAFQSLANLTGKNVQRDQVISLYMKHEAAVEAERYRPYRDVLTETGRRVAADLGLDLPESASEFLPESIGNWEPFPDTNDGLEKLTEKFRLGILSNIDDDLLSITRRKFPVEFDLIVTAQQVKSYKPGYAHFKEAQGRLPGSRHLHAAQSYFHDVVPCVALGIPVVWVNRKNLALPEGSAEPLQIVSDVASLAELLT